MALTATQQRGIRANKAIGENGVEVMTAEVPYLVAGLTSLTQAAHEVTQATGLPAIGSSGHGAICIGYRLEQPAEATASSAWRVWVQFGQWPAGSSSDPESHDPDPVKRPASITRRVVERTEIMFHDFSEPPQAIVNTLGDPFDPGVEASKYRMAITVQRYVTPANSIGNLITFYAGKVNQEQIGPFDPKTLLCRDIDETVTYEGVNPITGQPYRVVNQVISLEVDVDEWIVEVLNRGPQHLEKIELTGDYKAVSTMDANGVPTGEIVLLDDAGQRITWEQIAAGVQPHFVPFVTRKQVFFGGLNLPDLFSPFL